MPQLRDSQHTEIWPLLQSENKLERKQALQEVLNDFSNTSAALDEKSLLELWESIHRPVVRILHDSVEACRDLALDILKQFILQLPCSDKNIVYIIPILTKRLGSQELIEESEEVRLKCIIVLRAIVSKYQEKLTSYFQDLIIILTRTVTDKYPNVKKESCECICDIAKNIPSEFYSKSEVFIKPILTNMTHQHYKVRVTTVQTIGEVLNYGNSKSIETVAGPLAERLFDQSGVVRAAVVEVTGKWLTELKDKYSWWCKLIPLLLTGINDVVPEIRKKATTLWMSVGDQYIKENEMDPAFRVKMDNFNEKPSHYPADIIRPNLGCRTIVQQHFGKLIGAISRELNDWLADIKVRAAQLLCILVLNVEDEVTQHIAKLLPTMYRACNDEDSRVVENIELAAEYMGYFVPASTYCDLVIPVLEENPMTSQLKIFAALLRGGPRETLVPELTRIGQLLQDSHTCQSQKARYQMELLNCCQSLMNVCKEDCASISHDLFTAIFTTLAVSDASVVEEKAKELLNLLTKIESLDDTSQLYDKHIALMLTKIQDDPESWLTNSYEFYIFQASIVLAKSSTYKHLNLIHPVFEKTTGDSVDKKVRLKQFISLSNYLNEWNMPIEKGTAKIFIDFTNSILEKIIIPGLAWTAGRSAEAIRTASVCCLCALLNKIVDSCEKNDESGVEQEKQLSVSVEHFGWLFEKVHPTLVKLLEDDAYKTRLYTLQAMCLVINIGQKISNITLEHIHKTSPEIVSRLEDQHDEVRLAAIEALREIWKVLPKDYDLSFYYVHIDYVYTNMLIHLDDPKKKFQKQVLNCLLDLIKVHPELLIEKVQSSRANFINQKDLDLLVIFAQKYLKENNSLQGEK